MYILRSNQEMARFRRERAQAGGSVGMVPTMGSFHEGHLSLMRQAVAENGTTVVSLFVNPAQFGPGEDFDRYPRDEDGDRELARSCGVDGLFVPPVGEIYPAGDSTRVCVDGLTGSLCGAFRPGHFSGVATVLVKLFHIVRPDRAYFGEKDYQQLRVVQQMVRDLCFDLEVVACPIVRDPDGLAASSRNRFLSGPERTEAQRLSRALFAARDLCGRGVWDRSALVSALAPILDSPEGGLFCLEYLELVDPETLQPVDRIEAGSSARLALAARVGKTRLIDNILLERNGL